MSNCSIRIELYGSDQTLYCIALREMRKQRTTDTGDGWTEIQNGMSDMFTFYVAGFQDGTSKVDLRRVYDRFGQVLDIYISGKKNQRKHNFAFIRFKGVKDTRTLEAKMQGIKLRGITLLSNLAKYQKDKSQHRKPLTGRQADKKTKSKIWGSVRDSRSFAQVAADITGTRINNFSPNILLNSKSVMGQWIHKKILIGEAHSLDYIANLPYPIFNTDDTKYLGGL